MKANGKREPRQEGTNSKKTKKKQKQKHTHTHVTEEMEIRALIYMIMIITGATCIKCACIRSAQCGA